MSSIQSCSDITSKFTRGEKCIFVHLVITFVLLLIMLIMYFIHLFIVKHSGNDVLLVTRRTYSNENVSGINSPSDYHMVGVVYLDGKCSRIVCNALFLRARWSIAPAHCVATRSDPDMWYYLPAWRIKYLVNELEYVETDVKRNIVHTQFNRDDFGFNIGLFEHRNPIKMQEYLVLNDNVFNVEKALLSSDKYPVIVNWHATQMKGKDFVKTAMNLELMTLESCSNYVLPIIEELRSYEFCARLEHPTIVSALHHGAVYITDSKIIGFFSWGDKSGRGVPLVVVNVMAFKEWLEYIISI